MKKIEIAIAGQVLNPVAQAAEIAKRFYGLDIVVSEAAPEMVKIGTDAMDEKSIFSLGASICHIMYNWNRLTEEKIAQRSEVTPWGRKYFEGTEDEKNKINKDDKAKLISFPEKYFIDFVDKTRELNEDNIKGDGKAHAFTTDLNYSDTIAPAIDGYNKKFGTDFHLDNVYLRDEQLYFADVSSKNASLLDVFLLGFANCLKDEQIDENSRNRNKENS